MGVLCSIYLNLWNPVYNQLNEKKLGELSEPDFKYAKKISVSGENGFEQSFNGR